MESNSLEQARLEQLHRLYYNLAHRILPNIILSDNVDQLLQSNPEGEGMLSEAGTTQAIAEGNKTTEEANLICQAEAEADLDRHIAEQEEKRLELEAFDFEDEMPDFAFDGEQEDDLTMPGNLFDDEDFEDNEDDLPDDLFDDEDFEDDLMQDVEEVDESDPMVAQLIAELEASLELHKGRSGCSNPDEDFLNDTWREAWFDTTFEQIPDRAGYTLKRINQQSYEIVLFTFPEPIQVVDAHMAAAIRKPGEPYRYYTLEATVSEDEDTAVLAEWKAGGLHRNSGSRTTDVKNQEAFLQMVLNDLQY